MRARTIEPCLAMWFSCVCAHEYTIGNCGGRRDGGGCACACK